ncbi:hypothetical protein Taro_031928 [Colocasia esculenta]|uniref:Serine aminopeptidase S33 domain-containing protein n=1 Tax=Colocasia esculenta TaxID=4460 RepID=A0A843VK26_COLES|nr:hypothetical protein [Colocasia esculenta]
MAGAGAGRARWLAAAVLLAALGNWFHVSIRPPAPKRCGSPGGPPVMAPRVRVRDGRFLAYAEVAVSRAEASYKVVIAHGFTGSRLDINRLAANKVNPFRARGSVVMRGRLVHAQGVLEELGLYMVSYDRAGYGESDPNPVRSCKTEAEDVEDLADALQLGSKFYIVGFSLGGHAVWASLKYKPSRLAGAALLAPVINYRWPGFPRNLSAEAYHKQHLGDQWSLRVAYYAPWLLNWWMKQIWLPTSTVAKGTVFLPNSLDARLRDLAVSGGAFRERIKVATQQGVHESLNRDMIVIGSLPPVPFPVHVWHGDEDGLVPVTLQRYICRRLGWVEYHELPGTGHYLTAAPGFPELMLKTLLLKS